jgi:anhydro-N-acetylmuramic acid kinase
MTDGRKTYDADGAIAATGTVNRDLLEELMARSFIRQAPPEGAARQLFGHHYAAHMRERGQALGLSDADLVATATALTAESMAYAFKEFVRPRASG